MSLEKLNTDAYCLVFVSLSCESVMYFYGRVSNVSIIVC
jgi:hypothetical protein